LLTPISAATKAQAVAVGLLEGHIAHCVMDAAANGTDPSAKVKEASDAIARLVRS
jgi:DNA-binding FrmR family transcriptional regulator